MSRDRMNKCSKKTKRTMEYISMITTVGEEISSRALLTRMRYAEIPNKSGRIPQGWIPLNSTSLGMKLKGNKGWEGVPVNGSNNLWRRLE